MCYCISCSQLFTTPGYVISKNSKGLCNKCAISRNLKVCRTCCQKFPSRTLLFKHLNQKPTHQVDAYEPHLNAKNTKSIIENNLQINNVNNENTFFSSFVETCCVLLFFVLFFMLLAASKDTQFYKVFVR